MGEWKKTGCVLCAQNCGLEILVEKNRLVRVRPDKDNPRSRGYACRKGMNAVHYHHHADRLTHPLKRHGKGFRKISWDQAFSEISRKLGRVIGENGPRSFAYMGGGGQGCHFDAFFGLSFMRALGSRYHYNPLAQELTGAFWVNGRVLGRQNRFPIPHEEASDMIVAWGWNGMQSHQMPRAPLVLTEFSKNPDKILAAVDPRKSETARIADLHLAVRPGTDALLLRAMVALILEKGWEDKSYVRDRVSGWEEVRPWFENFDIRAALSVCGLDYAQVEEFCRLLSTRNWCMHPDLGVLMNRHSTATSYLQAVLTALCGRFCAPGGNVIPAVLMPMGMNSDERDPETWRTVETGFPAITGFFPPNALPEEILSRRPERVRAVITSSSNPLRSYADTSAYEKAFKKLDLLVTIELSMTETARMAHYVLPARSGYDSWDATFFSLNFPEVYFQMRRPLVEPEGERLECGEIFTGLAGAMGLIPEIPASLIQAAEKGRLDFALELAALAWDQPEALSRLPFVMARTLGREMGSAHLSMLWGMLQQGTAAYKSPEGKLLEPVEVFERLLEGRGLAPELPEFFRTGAGKALGKHLTALYGLSRVRPSQGLSEINRQGFSLGRAAAKAFSPERLGKIARAVFRQKSYLPLLQASPTNVLADDLFQAALDNPQGFWAGRAHEDNFREVRTPDGKIRLNVPEMEAWVRGITPEAEAEALLPDPRFPLILLAGRHMSANANTLMRNPEWNRKRRACTLLMNPEDAAELGLADGDRVSVFTEAGEENAELEVSGSARKGQVVLPHGFGLCYDGKVFGANANRLTRNTHRDPLAGTPLHRYVPCRVEAVKEDGKTA